MKQETKQSAQWLRIVCKLLFGALAIITVAVGCRTVITWMIRPSHSFAEQTPPPAPDYSSRKSWAALPGMKSEADYAPEGLKPLDSSEQAVDVFYVHPTTYYSDESWNANADEYSLELFGLKPLRQASVFHGIGRIYAPRYRQATLASFTEIGSADSEAALNIALDDIRRAFAYYLEHYNHGRPFILAGHSQGAYLMFRLMQEKLDDSAANRDKRFIVAYLAGASLHEDWFKNLKPCGSAEKTSCYVSWNSRAWGTSLQDFAHSNPALEGSVCVNPVSWRLNETATQRSCHLGSVDKRFGNLQSNYVEAKCEGSLLWVRHADNSDYESTFDSSNYHIMDYNLFYADIRANALVRIQAYMGQTQKLHECQSQLSSQCMAPILCVSLQSGRYDPGCEAMVRRNIDLYRPADVARKSL